MTTVRNIVPTEFDPAEGFSRAVDAYPINLWDREVTRERFPLDALVFAGYQTPYTSLDEYGEKRCTYDRETNAWLIQYVTEMAANVDRLPPVLIHIRPNGLCLVDGWHRASALLMRTDEIRIDAWVVQ